MSNLIWWVSGIAVAAVVWAFFLGPLCKVKHLERANTSSQLLAGLFTAVGISTAALLYVAEQQWSPRFSVDIKAEPHRIPNSDPPVALIQVSLSVTNIGRMAQTLSEIEVGAEGLAGPSAGRTDENGDLPSESFYYFLSKRLKDIESGETDLDYFEIPVACEWPLVRLVVKVPKPPYDSLQPRKERRVYERKALVPLTEICGTVRTGKASSG